MPCRSDGHGDSDECKLEECRKELNHVTAMLCFVCERMPDNAWGENPELNHWYDQHQAADARRRGEEYERVGREAEAATKRWQLRDRLRQQLTPEEREAVGL